MATEHRTDVVGNFPIVNSKCMGCQKPLLLENAWMADGCPCNSSLGVNNQNEYRWRLLMQLQQQQSYELSQYKLGEEPGESTPGDVTPFNFMVTCAIVIVMVALMICATVVGVNRAAVDRKAFEQQLQDKREEVGRLTTLLVEAGVKVP